MRNTFDDPRSYRDGLPVYRRRRGAGRLLLSLFFFMLGALTTIALSYVVNPALLRAFLELILQALGFLVQALFGALMWLLMHPSAFMLSVSFVMILVIIRLLRQRGRWR